MASFSIKHVCHTVLPDLELLRFFSSSGSKISGIPDLFREGGMDAVPGRVQATDLTAVFGIHAPRT